MNIYEAIHDGETIGTYTSKSDAIAALREQILNDFEFNESFLRMIEELNENDYTSATIHDYMLKPGVLLDKEKDSPATEKTENLMEEYLKEFDFPSAKEARAVTKDNFKEEIKVILHNLENLIFKAKKPQVTVFMREPYIDTIVSILTAKGYIIHKASAPECKRSPNGVDIEYIIKWED